MRDASSVHLHRFVQDVARWIRPGEIADPADVTWLLTARLLRQHPPLRAVAWFRLGSWLWDAGIPMLPGMIQRRGIRVYGIELVPGNTIGGGLYIAHTVGCTIFVETLGDNASVIAAVTVGTRGNDVWPRIGERVFLGAGARVLGDIDLGDDVNVGANAVVLCDVPSDSTAVGIPARVIDRSARRTTPDPVGSEVGSKAPT